METIIQMNEVMTAANVEQVKFAAGNKAAGTRLRAHMQTIKQLAQIIRAGVTAAKNV